MNTKFVSCLMSSVLALVAVAAPRPEQPWQTANKVKDELWKKGKTCGEIVDALEKMRGETYYATNAYTRAFIDRMIVGTCRRPGWTGLRRWNINLESRIPGVVRRDLDDPEVGYAQKIELACLLAEYLAGEKDFAGASAVIRSVMASSAKHTPYDEAKGWLGLARVCQWHDDFSGARQNIEKAAPLDPGAATRQAIALAKDLAYSSEAEATEKLVDALLAKMKPAQQLDVANGYKPEAMRKLALAFVRDANNDARARAQTALGWFALAEANERDQAFAALKGIDMTKVNVHFGWNSPINSLFWRGDWDGVEAIFKTYDGTKDLAKPNIQRIRVISLAAVGRKADALAVIEKNLKLDDAVRALTNKTGTALSALDRAKFAVSKAILEGGDIEKAIAAAKLERKDEIAAYATAARQALTWGLSETAEKMAAKHSAYFVDFPQRTLKVCHSKTPIETIADWRKAYAKLDRQSCDRKFGANLDALVTDVATGRTATEKTALDSNDVQMEISAMSDAKGLHVFLHVEDPNARAVENGFAGGVGTEMYFAPGKYEPYVCFGTNPRTGAEFAFQTSYDSLTHRRVDMMQEKSKSAFKFESAFTDMDYVQHLFFAWDSFYQKLPANGSKWRFECIAFGPKGPFSLGGSENVHNSSKWCDLEFALDKDDVTAIRRGLLYRHAKGWNQLGRLERFDKWADVEIGDPEFYEEVLRPIERELKGYAKEVKNGMSDADVNRVFEKALVRWMGIAHEIDELRRVWLLERMCR